MNSFTFRRLLNYFLRGLLFLVPVALTLYILVVCIQWLDSLIPVNVPGLGLIFILVGVTLFGYLGSTLLIKPFFDFLEELLEKVPFVNLIYTSIKDLIEAFVGDKKKFNQAVVIDLDDGVQKLGFITQPSLDHIGLSGKVAVYCPHSYNFSGNLFVVPLEKVKPIHNVASSDFMKFVVSGGVSGLPSAQEIEVILEAKNIASDDKNKIV